MPTYTFQNRETGEEKTEFMSYSEAVEIDKQGVWKLLPSAPLIVTGHGDVRSKIDGGFNDVLKSIKKANWKSTIETR